MRGPFTRSLTFRHTGHIGDIIAFLPVFYAMGGTKLLIADELWGLPMTGFKYDSVKPLLVSQGIEVELNSNTPSIDYDVSNWRECYEHHISLTDAQARYLRLVPRGTGHLSITGPWLKVDADPCTRGRVIFNRTPRYRNPGFCWKDALVHFGSRSLFIGTKEEHEEFERLVGKIEHHPTADCLKIANAIEGADFFVGNQSSSFWIAAALRKPLVQEVDLVVTNSIIEYAGAHYPRDGKIDFSKS